MASNNFKNNVTQAQLVRVDDDGTVTKVIAERAFLGHQTPSKEIRGGKYLQFRFDIQTGEDNMPYFNQVAHIDPNTGAAWGTDSGASEGTLVARIYRYTESGKGLAEALKVGDNAGEWVTPEIPAAVKNASAKKAKNAAGAVRTVKGNVPPAVLAALGMDVPAETPAEPTPAAEAEEAAEAMVAALASEAKSKGGRK